MLGRDQGRVVGYACRAEKPEFVTLYVGKFRSALRGAGLKAEEYRIHTKGAKEGRPIRVFFGGRARDMDIRSILDGALGGAGTVNKPEFEPIYSEENPSDTIQHLTEELEFAQDSVEEAQRAAELAAKNEQIAYNSTTAIVAERDLLTKQREETSKLLEEAREKYLEAKEELDGIRTQFDGAVRDNASLRKRAKSAEEERNHAEERYTQLLSEQAKRAKTPEELLVAAVRDYGEISQLDGYMKELLENFPGGDFNSLNLIASHGEDNFVSSQLKELGVRHEDISPEPMPAWEETSEHKSGFPEYLQARDSVILVEAGMKGIGIGKDKLPQSMREILEKSEAVKIQFEDAEKNYKRKAYASKAAIEAGETYRRLKGLADKVSVMTPAEIPVVVIYDKTEIRVYAPNAGGNVSSWISERVTSMLGYGFDTKEDGSTKVFSKRVEPAAAVGQLSNMRNLRGAAIPKPLTGSLKLTILES